MSHILGMSGSLRQGSFNTAIPGLLKNANRLGLAPAEPAARGQAFCERCWSSVRE
jgi:hypothetical protein